MLWHKSWLETRWRFAIGLALLACAGVAVVLVYPRVKELAPMVTPPADAPGELARKLRESLELARDYRAYLWSQWFSKQQIHMWTLFAVLLGTGGLVTQSARGGALFTLSLPVSRGRLLAVRAATGLAELAVLAVSSALLVAAASPAVGEHYAIGDAMVYAGCTVVAGSVFFSFAALLSTVFSDIWRPLGFALFAAIVLGLAEQVYPEVSRFSVFPVMSATSYFRGDGVPWLGLLVSAAISTAMLWGAARNIARQDF
jgi:hypothetical protein